jgi:DegV family protein with EDD domain
MPKVAVITDSDCSLPHSLTNELGIRQVPITVQFGEEILRSGLDIDDALLFQRVDREGKLPTTAAPSPGDFLAAYKAAFENDKADEIVCFCVSGDISGTYNAAKVAAEELSDKKITVVDTQTLSMGQGYMVLGAFQALKDGATLHDAVNTAKAINDRSHLYGALATLKYLSMSGRVSHLAAGMAGMLNIKPILSVQNGKLDMLEKVRTRKKAWDRVVELCRNDSQGKKIVEMAVLDVNASSDADEFETLLRENLDCPKQILRTELSAGLSVHTGAGLVAVAFVTDK